LKKIRIVLLLIFSGFKNSVFSQADTLQKKKIRRVWINLMVSPEINSLHTANPFGYGYWFICCTYRWY
jgi:hypothetical protein